MTLIEFIACLGIGLTGGLLGGMLGIGGSLVMIPALALLFGSEKQHLYQAAAMMVNVVVALAAVGKHWQAGVVRTDALRSMVPAALIAIILGVLASNQLNGIVLARCFAVFLLYVIYMNVRKLINEIKIVYKNKNNHVDNQQQSNQAMVNDRSIGNVTVPKGITVGSIMGFMAGLLGIGGGGIGVPLQQVIFKIPLKQCIGTSTFVICITAGIGAIVKNATLPDPYTFIKSLTLAGALAPSALIGAYFGASLTHRFRTYIVRSVFILLLIAAGSKMAGFWG